MVNEVLELSKRFIPKEYVLADGDWCKRASEEKKEC